eukprot:819954_1
MTFAEGDYSEILNELQNEEPNLYDDAKEEDLQEMLVDNLRKEGNESLQLQCVQWKEKYEQQIKVNRETLQENETLKLILEQINQPNVQSEHEIKQQDIVPLDHNQWETWG